MDPDDALMETDPTAIPFATPALVTVATDAFVDDHVTDCVMFF
jgi:hypothetical protein